MALTWYIPDIKERTFHSIFFFFFSVKGTTISASVRMCCSDPPTDEKVFLKKKINHYYSLYEIWVDFRLESKQTHNSAIKQHEMNRHTGAVHISMHSV